MRYVETSVNSSDLKQAISFLNAAMPKSRSRAVSVNCEFTLANNEMELSVPGAAYSISTWIKSAAKASVPFLLLKEYVYSMESGDSQVVIKDNRLKINNFETNVKTWFFENDSILRSIKLSVNYSDPDLIALPNFYIWEEIEFNNLLKNVDSAYVKLEEKTNEAATILQAYGISRQELLDFTMSKIFKGDDHKRFYPLSKKLKKASSEEELPF